MSSLSIALGDWTSLAVYSEDNANVSPRRGPIRTFFVGTHVVLAAAGDLY